jgi:hypothetical protein
MGNALLGFVAHAIANGTLSGERATRNDRQ